MKPQHIYIELSGSSREIGLKYGQEAKVMIHRNLEFYKVFFKEYAHMEWNEAQHLAQSFIPLIEKSAPDLLEEMRAIAEGAELSFEDILTLNCRSEVIFARPDGCSFIGFLSKHGKDGHVYMGQTWDWLIPAVENVCVLKIQKEGKPDQLIAVEAGMVGGKGLNSAGIGACLNALSVGKGKVGMPLHVLYRMILNTTKASDAVEVVSLAQRAGSGNFDIGTASDYMFCLEYTPDNFDVLMSEGEPICHTNHYLSPLFLAQDTFKRDLPETFMRLNTLRRKAKELEFPVDEKTIFGVLSSHQNFPDSVCSHEDPIDSKYKRFCTIYGIVMDLTARRLWITDGRPCEGKISTYAL